MTINQICQGYLSGEISFEDACAMLREMGVFPMPVLRRAITEAEREDEIFSKVRKANG